MYNMLMWFIVEELFQFGELDCVILNVGCYLVDFFFDGVVSEICVLFNVLICEMLILGMEYVGEMKKGVFILMNYLMLCQGVLLMYCLVNEGMDE